MTKDEAAAAITRALAAQGPITGTLSIDAFASRFATSLETLGLLMLACDPAIQAAGANLTEDDPFGRADVPPASRHEQLMKEDDARDRIAAGEAALNAWATSRERS